MIDLFQLFSPVIHIFLPFSIWKLVWKSFNRMSKIFIFICCSFSGWTRKCHVRMLRSGNSDRFGSDDFVLLVGRIRIHVHVDALSFGFAQKIASGNNRLKIKKDRPSVSLNIRKSKSRFVEKHFTKNYFIKHWQKSIKPNLLFQHSRI
jgi:hypothetical protein